MVIQSVENGSSKTTAVDVMTWILRR